jgi:hypothetical protein
MAPSAPAPSSAFAVVGSDLVELDPVSGAVVRTIVPFFEGDGVFRGDLELTPDRSAAYFGEGYEDSWFSCDASLGKIGRVDLTSGRVESFGPGWSPSLSNDGGRLAFLTSTVCLPDPEEPEFWVLTPADRVVVVDLATSERVEILSATSPVHYSDPNALDWVAFHPSGDLLVGIAAGDVHRVDSRTAGTVQSGPVVFRGDLVVPIAVAEASFVAVTFGDEGATTVVEVDLATGIPRPIWESESFVAVGGDRAGNVVVIDPGAAASTASGRLTVLALDTFASAVAW